MQENGHEADHEKHLKQELNNLLEQEDLRWRQRAKVDWLKGGDCNSKYFHASVKQRRRRNQILEIEDVEGNKYTTQETVEQAFVEYFQDLFSTSSPASIDEATRAVKRSIIADMNAQLLEAFTVEEVKAALDQMAQLKSPGPDGFTSRFYQNALGDNWPRGLQCYFAILKFFSNG